MAVPLQASMSPAAKAESEYLGGGFGPPSSPSAGYQAAQATQQAQQMQSAYTPTQQAAVAAAAPAQMAQAAALSAPPPYIPTYPGENPGYGGYASAAAEEAAIPAAEWLSGPPSGAWDYQYSGGKPIPGTEAYALAQVAGGPLGYASGGGPSSIISGYTPKGAGGGAVLGGGGGVSGLPTFGLNQGAVANTRPSGPPLIGEGGLQPTSFIGQSPWDIQSSGVTGQAPYQGSGVFNPGYDPGGGAALRSSILDPGIGNSDISGVSLGGGAVGDIPGSPVDTQGMQTAFGTEPTFSTRDAPQSDMSTMPEVAGGLAGGPFNFNAGAPQSGLSGDPLGGLGDLLSPFTTLAQPDPFRGTGGPTDVGPGSSSAFTGSENPSGPSSIPPEAFSQTPLAQQQTPLMTGATSDPFGPPILGSRDQSQQSTEPTFAQQPIPNLSGAGQSAPASSFEGSVPLGGDPAQFQSMSDPNPFSPARQRFEQLGTTNPTLGQTMDAAGAGQYKNVLTTWPMSTDLNARIDFTQPSDPQLQAILPSMAYNAMASRTPPPGLDPASLQAGALDYQAGHSVGANLPQGINPGATFDQVDNGAFSGGPGAMSTGPDLSPQNLFGGGSGGFGPPPLSPNLSSPGGSGITFPQIPPIGGELAPLDQGPESTFARQPPPSAPPSPSPQDQFQGGPSAGATQYNPQESPGVQQLTENLNVPFMSLLQNPAAYNALARMGMTEVGDKSAAGINEWIGTVAQRMAGQGIAMTPANLIGFVTKNSGMPGGNYWQSQGSTPSASFLNNFQQALQSFGTGTNFAYNPNVGFATGNGSFQSPYSRGAGGSPYGYDPLVSGGHLINGGAGQTFFPYVTDTGQAPGTIAPAPTIAQQQNLIQRPPGQEYYIQESSVPQSYYNNIMNQLIGAGSNNQFVGPPQ